ncbi:MAG: antiviral reverse transcriptase Drt3b [Parvibaculum sp.]|uniref:antiviral reverse transcriptase Drt3b n=1 Tax=Parvibaculum sp. TaxID=2024848 RepID=UPI0032EF9A6E
MNRRYIKGNLRRSDHLRTLLTDTSPYEVPIIVSNDGFYRNLLDRSKFSPALRELIESFVIKNEPRYTVPYRYKIEKDSTSTRQLSLIHPTSQYRVVEFYQRYAPLVIYYSSIGRFSLRRPVRPGSTFFFRSDISDLNQYKNNQIDTESVERLTRNPASYFAYSGVSRLYKFFASSEFLRLEKKYSQMALLDVTKCFSSIYTHSISWAVKGAQHSKDNVNARSFGNDFDKLMQKMNFNETNGICVGPELSRIFAEIILNAIDALISEQAYEAGLVAGRDYDCRRYVDDFIVFADNKETFDIVRRIIADALGVYNLHLNDGKEQTYSRPFVTTKSAVIDSAKEALGAFFDGIIEKNETRKLILPKKIYRSDAVVRSLVLAIKRSCYSEGVGYEASANYIIASLTRRIEMLIEGYEDALATKACSSNLYPPVLLRLMEAIFFFYTVRPTVSASYHVGRAIIVLWRFFDKHLPDERFSVSGQIHGWVSQLLRQYGESEPFHHRRKVPIEFLNVVLAVREIDESQPMDSEVLRRFVLDPSREDYFSLVSSLYFAQRRPEYQKLREDVEDCVVRILGDCRGVLTNAHDAHLALDSICCPYLPMNTRTHLLSSLRKALNLPNRRPLQLREDVAEMEGHPWFVQWESLDILRMVKKKELSSVY